MAKTETPVKQGDLVVVGWAEVRSVEEDGRFVVEIIDHKGGSVQFLTVPPDCVWRVEPHVES